MGKVLVMGGSYFIGKKIVDVLVENGFQVSVLNRGNNPFLNSNVQQLTCDRNDVEKLSQVLSNQQFDYVVDVSGLDKQQAELLCDSLNIESLKRFVFISSSAVYDVENLNIPYVETDPSKENIYWGEYGKNKIEAEEYYIQKFSDTEVKLAILRPPYVYGENNYVERESFIFEHIYNNKPIIIPKSNPKLQFIYTTDLANIVVDMIRKVEDKVGIYNVGNKNAVTAEEWVNACAKAVGKTANIIQYDYKPEGWNIRDFFSFNDYNNVLDVSKIRNISDYETDFLVGLKVAFEWYNEVKDSIKFKENVAKNEIQILNQLNYDVNREECTKRQ